jgi:hypothetical protein
LYFRARAVNSPTDTVDVADLTTALSGAGLVFLRDAIAKIK